MFGLSLFSKHDMEHLPFIVCGTFFIGLHHHHYLGLSLMQLQKLFVLVSFLPEPNLLVAVVELPGALPLPDELLRLLLQHVQLAPHRLIVGLAALHLCKMMRGQTISIINGQNTVYSTGEQVKM